MRNFGDFLTELLVDRALIAPLVDATRYRLIGSALDRFVLGQDLSLLGSGETIACWGCGARDATSLPADIALRVSLFGVRGPMSRIALGLPDDTPLGDPGLLLPLLHQPPAARHGETICIPHFFEPLGTAELLAQTGADRIASPRVADHAEMERLIDDIAGAGLVLAGSLHAAIVAAAYGTPFAFLDLGFVDTPFKWQDFAASIGIDAAFVTTLAEARTAADRNVATMALPPLVPLLGCCPWAVRPSVLLAAAGHDAAAGYHAETGSLLQDRSDFRALAASTGLPSATPPASDALAALARIAEEATALANHAAAQLAAAQFSFEAGTEASPYLDFVSGTAGHAMLGEGWSAPNAVGAVSHGYASSLVLPATCGWPALGALTLEGYLFSPPEPPFAGSRKVVVHANGARLFEGELANPAGDESFLAHIRINLPLELRARGGPLRLDLGFEPCASPLELGMGFDDRRIGIALLRILGEHAASGCAASPGIAP